jgi:DNA (cytosine-5)-methyltransferase 1
MNFGSVCSGIEAASMAWNPLGWRAQFVSEIDKFPCALLEQRHPTVPNFGDMTKFKDWPDAAIDVLVGGTPCQSFSVAGLRKGLDDPRGNLMLTYLAIAARYSPQWLVWENVPGVLSSGGGRDFGSFLAGLGQLGYGWAYRVLDAQYFKLAQRRERVFVVGCLGGWQRAAAVLFERASLRGDLAPSRQAGKNVAGTVGASSSSGRSYGSRPIDANLISHSLLAKGNSSHDPTMETYVTHALRADGFDASEDGTGRGTPLTLAIRGRGGESTLEWRDDGLANAILTPNGGRAGIGVGAIAFNARQDPISSDISGPIDTDGTTQAIAFAIQAGALRENPESGPDGVGVKEDVAYTIEARAEVQAVAFVREVAGTITSNYGKQPDSSDTALGPNIVAFAQNGRSEVREMSVTGAVAADVGVQQQTYVKADMAVRRLTPRECERLQGFPDDYTLIEYRGKPAADGPRYKALGNSMARPVMGWIGKRIELVNSLVNRKKEVA